jgi:hypothetical protein
MVQDEPLLPPPAPKAAPDDARSDTPPASPAASSPETEQKRQTGRAARLQAEDAADAAARAQRWRSFSDVARDAPAEDTPPPPARRAPSHTLIYIALAVALIGFTARWWLPRFEQVQRGGPTPAPVSVAVAPTQPAPPPAPPPPAATSAQPGETVADSNARVAAPVNGSPSTTTAPPSEPAPPAGPIGDVMANQAKQVAALTARVAALEGALGNSTSFGDLDRRLDSLEGKSASAASVLSLADRVTALETTSRIAVAEQTVRIGLVLAVAQWREALAAGRPFTAELGNVKAIAARGALALPSLDDPRFVAYAPEGIATLPMLQARFDDSAASALRAAAVPGGFNGLWGRSLERILSIVTVRRVNGLVAGSTPSAIIARAGAYLKEGNLAAAVTELEHLTGGPAEAASAWLNEARARVAAEQAATDATNKALSALAATPATAPAEAPHRAEDKQP